MQGKERSLSLRVDRWLCNSRFYKTRNMAAEACKKNWVKVNEHVVKASKEIKLGDVVKLKFGPLKKTIRVEGITNRRVSAKNSVSLWKDLTSDESYLKAKEKKIHLNPRSLSKKYVGGRPTKRQRRELEDFLYPDEDL